MGGKMVPNTGFCADSNEVNPNITNAKSASKKSAQNVPQNLS